MPFPHRLIASGVLGGSAPFTPVSISSLEFLLDISAEVGLSDGNAMGTGTDQSGNGRNVTQGTAANKPTYKTGIANGLPVARFDGNDSWSLADATIFGIGTQIHIFAVIDPSTTTNPPVCNVRSGEQGFEIGEAVVPYMTTGKTSFAGTNAGAGGGVGFHIIEGSYDNATRKCWINGGNIGSASVANQLQVPAGAFYVGRDEGVTYFTGDIAYLAIFSSVLTTAEQTNMRNYLSAKFAISLT